MIYSGDRIVLYGPKDKEGLFCEKVIQLICVKSPRMGMINEKKKWKICNRCKRIFKEKVDWIISWVLYRRKIIRSRCRKCLLLISRIIIRFIIKRLCTTNK